MTQPEQRSRHLSGVATSTGIVSLELRPTSTYPWTIEQIGVESTTTTTGARCTIRLNGNLVTPLVPNADAAAEQPYIEVQPTDVIGAYWTGLSAGDRCDATFYYRQG